MDNLFKEDLEEGLFQNKETLDEILLRLMLLFELGTKKKELINNMSIAVDVRDTFFPFSDLLNPEAFHVYDVSLNLNRNSLNYFLHILEDNEFGMARSINSVKPYFDQIFSLDRRLKYTGCEMKDSILGWNGYFKSASSFSLIPERYITKIDLSFKPVIEINRDSEFIKRTDPLIKKLENELREDVNKSFIRQFGIQYDQILPFIDITKRNNPSEIRNFLEANFPDNLLKLDLILRIIDFPDLEAIDLDEYEMDFDEELIDRMLKLEKEDMLITISKFIALVAGMMDFDTDYDPNKLLQSSFSGSM
jgi:hypothetical protein